MPVQYEYKYGLADRTYFKEQENYFNDIMSTWQAARFSNRKRRMRSSDYWHSSGSLAALLPEHGTGALIKASHAVSMFRPS
jgi:hypothetical protein